jgi:carbamoyl-phosphate synthase large subunit
METIFRKKDISEKTILEFLEKVDLSFPIPLSEKTNLTDYAKKIYENGTICGYVENGEIVSMVAGYLDKIRYDIGYITLVATLPEYQGRGIAHKVIRGFLKEAEEMEIRGVHLYTVRNNKAVVRMYNNLRFEELCLESEARPKDVHLMHWIQQKTALVTAIGSFSAGCSVKSLKEIGYQVVGCDIYDGRWIAETENVDRFYQVPKAVEEEAFLEVLLDICKREKITKIIPSTDVEVDFFNKYRIAFEEKYITICISGKETLDICRNKKRQQELLSQREGFSSAIPTAAYTEGMELPFSFPMVCKPLDGRSSQGLTYVRDEKEWAHFTRTADSRYIIQPYIEGDIVTVDVIRQRDGQKTVAIPRKELLRTLNGAGTSVKVFSDEKLEEECRKIAELLDIKGCVNFEFIQYEDRYYFIECNPRFSGGIAFSCIAGYDCIHNHMRCFKNKEIEDQPQIKEMYIARKYEEHIMLSQE